MLQYNKKMAFYIVLAIFFVSLDRFFKIFALNYLSDNKISLFGDIFGLSLAKNYNIAFSLPVSGSMLTAFITVIILILGVYWLYLLKKAEINKTICLTFCLFGAISNIIDRFKYGYVVDYFDLKYFTVFNLADTMIVCGVFCLLIINFKYENV
ncbi:MAG: Lipoprotein signal peptidase [Candidatus Falkowbacteria bacterium GW2011_GWC2_38_22]|uniref:Lipoprotein signal peptidase n=1 Tax=Candidatus Falkowbacteria bacterium GW2011_GWE1_38_31 TaxID=1618638 RepID=A0A0G0K422_9BACT|nr:MAG: Lipoprotein signal peptidase [Candidatus Falkowbacteria bacterium GW2011_GWF2_38_1205]KKQ61060.1 MAG: Lipoprotein signal peptidase [Candidatus Falkowbacteria bacterium GW2011_GWC2_38_22]KKQ63411.1 MAG: Lipoprotein signal peptidase [Candidatus Falkowbacteria bacterium GW2011_GWF1_38_22]KKQ65518.1 MAG: Lipoprotein signal peptidase [Candidatus Falkowbacteria bacterium GW2011_GWE2_38_254]KKQ70175.1 MAG: Lipoprotein signal peptidase [Candidatus Falkowbacteria bacterium GW2011_GWE1_38_31]KKQ